MTNTSIMILEQFNYRNEVSVMSKIITFFIKILNRINKIIWKICIFLSSLIPVEEIDKLNDKPTNERYRHFKVDE